MLAAAQASGHSRVGSMRQHGAPAAARVVVRPCPVQRHYTQQHTPSSRRRHIAHYKAGGAAAEGQQQQATKSAAPAIPAPQDMQASVMLVPKAGAEERLAQAAGASAAGNSSPVAGFLVKCKLAWDLFFPPQPDAAPALSAKDLGKQRLSMILVADRCGMSPSSIVEMKRNTLAAISDCMNLEDLQDAHLRFTMTRHSGTTYSVAVPVLRDGPYAADGTVVGQQQQRDAGRAAAAASAAAAAAAVSWDEEADDEQDYLSDEDDADESWDDDATAAAAAAAADEDAGAGGVAARAATNGAAAAAVAAAACAGAAAPAARAATAVLDAAAVSAEQDAGAVAAPTLPTGDSAAISPAALKQLLVDELVQDTLSAAATAPAVAGGALSEQLRVAVDEVQHFGLASEAGGDSSKDAHGQQA